MIGAPPLALEEAQSRLLALASTPGIEHVAVDETLGRILAEPVTALRTQPARDMSAMDGYALRADDLAQGVWKVIGESACGHPFAETLAAGEAVRIATGALIPNGADCVVVQEDCARNGTTLRLTGTAPHPPSRHIRRTGSDFSKDNVLLAAGMRISPAQIAVALAGGHTHLAVSRRPKLTIIDSGDELVPPGHEVSPDKIPASNGAMLAALAASIACRIERQGPVKDNLDMLVSTLDAVDSDVIVTTGGASVGEHDLMLQALENMGCELSFWRVAIKPGKPVLVATRTIENHRQIIVGLPGNPISALVTGYLFLLPLLRKMQGAAQCLPRRISARAGVAFAAGGSRREVRRGIWDGDTLFDGSNHDSGALASMARCNCLIDRPAHAPSVAPGDILNAWLLADGGML